MNIFKPTTLTWWQLGLLKLDVLIVGLLLGANFSGAVIDKDRILLVVFVILTIYIGVIWWREHDK